MAMGVCEKSESQLLRNGDNDLDNFTINISNDSFFDLIIYSSYVLLCNKYSPLSHYIRLDKNHYQIILFCN